MGFPQINYQEGVIIPEVFTAENSVAKQAGIQAGDIVLAINDQPLGASQNAIIDFRDIIQSSPNFLGLKFSFGGRQFLWEIFVNINFSALIHSFPGM